MQEMTESCYTNDVCDWGYVWRKKYRYIDQALVSSTTPFYIKGFITVPDYCFVGFLLTPSYELEIFPYQNM